MDVKISKWGNSLAVRIPKALAEQAGFREGDALEITAEARSLTLKRGGRKPRYRLEDLMAAWPEGVKAEEIDWGPPVGKEIW